MYKTRPIISKLNKETSSTIENLVYNTLSTSQKTLLFQAIETTWEQMQVVEKQDSHIYHDTMLSILSTPSQSDKGQVSTYSMVKKFLEHSKKQYIKKGQSLDNQSLFIDQYHKCIIINLLQFYRSHHIALERLLTSSEKPNDMVLEKLLTSCEPWKKQNTVIEVHDYMQTYDEKAT